MARNASEPAIRLSNPEELAPPPGYSNIVEISGGRIIFIAGQTALEKHGDLVGKGDFEAQADQVFRNISAALGRWLLSDERRAISRSSPSSCATWESLQPIAAPAIASSRR
jgi:enamine deaminase RidA (YjgF/YER057c/UK114 family)